MWDWPEMHSDGNERRRIVGAYIGSAHGAGQFYSPRCNRHAGQRRPRRASRRPGRLQQRKREFAADAYEYIIREPWKPFERPVDNPGETADRKAAEQMAAFG
jgi:hypothetical protein